jgi:hypothetical protein
MTSLFCNFNSIFRCNFSCNFFCNFFCNLSLYSVFLRRGWLRGYGEKGCSRERGALGASRKERSWPLTEHEAYLCQEQIGYVREVPGGLD